MIRRQAQANPTIPLATPRPSGTVPSMKQRWNISEQAYLGKRRDGKLRGAEWLPVSWPMSAPSIAFILKVPGVALVSSNLKWILLRNPLFLASLFFSLISGCTTPAPKPGEDMRSEERKQKDTEGIHFELVRIAQAAGSEPKLTYLFENKRQTPVIIPKPEPDGTVAIRFPRFEFWNGKEWKATYTLHCGGEPGCLLKPGEKVFMHASLPKAAQRPATIFRLVSYPFVSKSAEVGTGGATTNAAR